MKNWWRVAILGVVGLVVGGGGAALSVRAGALGAQTAIGPWATGHDFGTERASRYTRAVVALRGLLALPASEARYYTAATDDSGAPLDGACRYVVSGGRLPAKWWSLTLYDRAGYLVANDPGIYSIGSAGLPAAEADRWRVVVAPARMPGHWLPTARITRFELTLRLYLPDDGGVGDPTAAQLPRITNAGCA